MQNLLWVRLCLGNLSFSNTRLLSPGFPYQTYNVCIKYAGSKADIKYAGSKENISNSTATNMTAPWLLPLGVTGCYSSCAIPHPRAFSDVLSSLHSPPDPAAPKQPPYLLLSSDFLLWAQVQAPGPGQSCAGQGEPSLCQSPEPRTCALRPRQGLGEEQVGRWTQGHVWVSQPAAVQSKFAFLRVHIKHHL